MRSSKSVRFLNSIILGLISLYFDVLKKRMFLRHSITKVNDKTLFVITSVEIALFRSYILAFI